MADQYQGFSNPTIIPSQPQGWQGANQQTAGAIGAFGNLIKQRYQAQETMKNSLAQSLLSAKLNRLLYPGMSMGGPQVDQQLDSLISQNPYARNMLAGISKSFGQQGQGQQNTQGYGNPSSQGVGAPITQPNANGDTSSGGSGITPLGLGDGSQGPFNPVSGCH